MMMRTELIKNLIESRRCRRGVGPSPRRDRRQLSRKIPSTAPPNPPPAAPLQTLSEMAPLGIPCFE